MGLRSRSAITAGIERPLAQEHRGSWRHVTAVIKTGVLSTLDPTFEERTFTPLELAPRLATLEGTVIGLLDNNKKNAGQFLQYVAERLLAECGVAKIVRLRKSNATAPAPPEVMLDIIRCDGMITAIGDCGSCSSCTLHDAIAAEEAGTPAVGVMTDTFVPAAELMAEMCGASGYGFAVIEHPFSSEDPEQLRRKAAETVRQAVSLLTQRSVALP